MTATATLDQTATTAAADGLTRRHAVVPTGLGEMTLVAEGDALVGVYFAGHRPQPDRTSFGVPVDPDEDATLQSAAQQLAEYAAGTRETFDVPLRPVGSERARQVWQLVAAVPRGETTTYAALGRAVGVGPRAAGQFVARNPLCVVVPCHRVVASDGRLTGYAGGVDRKRLLLELEGALTAGAATATPTTAPPATDSGGSDSAEGGAGAAEAGAPEGEG